MTSSYIQNTFENVYKDDYSDSAGYHRILFNAGRPVQGRELIQAQTIIQKEMKRFGDNIFKDGGAVNPSQNVKCNTRHHFVKLLPSDDPTTATLLTTFTGATSGVSGKLFEYRETEHGDPPTIFVQYTEGGGVLGVNSFTAGETISNGAVTFTVQTTNTEANPATGRCTKISVGDGDFYTQGHFTYGQAQSLIIDKYSPLGTAIVGFKVTESIVSATDDISLYDNQGDLPNLTAPGADRYKISLTLVNDSDVASDETFVYVANVQNGEVVQTNNGRDDYNRILDLMAERTHEESGNYAVRPFFITFEPDSADTHLLVNTPASVGYVDGYRIETLNEKLRIAKPTSTELVNNDGVSAEYGNYLLVNTVVGLPDLTSYEKINLVDSDVYASGNVIGTTRVRSIVDEGSGTFKFYMFDTEMHTGKNFRNVKAVGTGVSNNAKITLESNVAVLKDRKNSNLLFSLPKERPSSISAADYTYSVVRHASKTVSTNTITLTKGTGESFTSTDEWIFTDQGASGAQITATNINTTTGLVTFTSATGPVDAVYNIQKGGAGAPTPYKTKTLNESTVTASVTTDSDGTYVDLGKVDIFSVSRVRAIDSDGADLSSRFYVDNGQRDNYYDHGRMVVAPGTATPAGNVFVRFKHFDHSGVGDFFCINSYDTVSDITYATVPSHRQTNGETVPLRDVLDFRPTIDDTGTEFTGTGGLVSELPQNTDLVTIDTTYYLPRKDRLLLNRKAKLSYVTGEPDFNPKPPSTNDAMILYEVDMRPNTLNEQDLGAEYIDNRRWTMRDISILHKKIEAVEETAVLSLLDIQASTLEVLDNDGLSRTKAGFLTDDFRDHRAARVDDLEYRASIDPTQGIMRPSFREKNVGLLFDSADGATASTILKSDAVMLDYTEELFISQSLCSGTENVNPYTIMYFEGTLILSPASDESRDVVNFSLRGDRRSEIGIETFLQRVLGQEDTNSVFENLTRNQREQFIRNRISVQEATNFTSSGSLEEAINTLPPQQNQILAQVFDTISPTWREYTWGWSGIERTANGSSQGVGPGVTDGSTFGRFATRLFTPRIRAREIRMRAAGLLPNARHWPFFDDIDVSDYCVQNQRIGVGDFPSINWEFSRRESNWQWSGFNGRLFQRARSNNWHPFWGTTAPTDEQRSLITSSNGTINASFFMPNNEALWFWSGVKVMKLVDVSDGNINNAVSHCQGIYSAEGAIDVRWRIIPPPPPPPPPPASTATGNIPDPSGADPIAQSFMVENPAGVFITKVSGYFKSKDDTIPVSAYIVPMMNGYPMGLSPYAGAYKILSPSEVNISDDATAVTDFEFDRPVYLPPGEHSLVFKTNSFDYKIFISRVGEFVLGTTLKKITKQPTFGSLFKSQNSSTWSASQWEDLKMDIYRADFATDGVAIFKNDDFTSKLLVPNPFLFDSGDATVRVIHPNHNLMVNDVQYFHGVDSAQSYPMDVNSIVGNRTITAVDGTGYTFEADSAATSDARTGGESVWTCDNLMMDLVVPSIDVVNQIGTTSSLKGKFTSGKSLAGLETPYGLESTFSHNLVPYEEYQFNAPRMVVGEELEGEVGYPTKSSYVQATLHTDNTWVSPVIHTDRCSLTGIHNLIDNQDSAATVGLNVPLSYIDETDPFGGTQLAKYVTKPVTLEEDAVGLKIIYAANRPSVAGIKVYYKLIDDDGDINAEPWTLIGLEAPVRSDEDPKKFREHRHLVGGTAGLDTPFNTFQVKIVMTSTNSSKVPVFRDFKAIALTI